MATTLRPPPLGVDALPPRAMARRAEAVGQEKAALPVLDLVVLAVLAGAFIALGAAFSTVVGAGAEELPYGVARLLAGLAFSLGLVLVVARTTADRILAVVPPITAFVAAGFEHSVANMYFIPLGLFVKSDGAWLEGRTSRPDLEALSWSGFAENLLPVTVGNVIGGTLLVGAVYWFVYLRPRRRSTPHDEAA